jgi:hypothetical protein
MKSKKINVKKILYIALLSVLGLIFVASLTFGVIAAFTNDARESIEVWYNEEFEKEISLLKQSITWLLISATLLVFTLSFKDFKKKFID